MEKSRELVASMSHLQAFTNSIFCLFLIHNNLNKEMVRNTIYFIYVLQREIIRTRLKHKKTWYSSEWVFKIFPFPNLLSSNACFCNLLQLVKKKIVKKSLLCLTFKLTSKKIQHCCIHLNTIEENCVFCEFVFSKLRTQTQLDSLSRHLREDEVNPYILLCVSHPLEWQITTITLSHVWSSIFNASSWISLCKV